MGYPYVLTDDSSDSTGNKFTIGSVELLKQSLKVALRISIHPEIPEWQSSVIYCIVMSIQRRDGTILTSTVLNTSKMNASENVNNV